MHKCSTFMIFEKLKFSIFSSIFHDFQEFENPKIMIKHRKIDFFKIFGHTKFFKSLFKNLTFALFTISLRIKNRNSESTKMEPLRKKILAGNCLLEQTKKGKIQKSTSPPVIMGPVAIEFFFQGAGVHGVLKFRFAPLILRFTPDFFFGRCTPDFFLCTP